MNFTDDLSDNPWLMSFISGEFNHGTTIGGNEGDTAINSDNAIFPHTDEIQTAVTTGQKPHLTSAMQPPSVNLAVASLEGSSQAE